MVYSVFGDVRIRVDTDIIDADITTLIEEVDAWLDLQLDMGNLTVPMQRMLSATRTAIMCMLKDPNSRGLGDYSEDRGIALKKLNDELELMIMSASGGMAFRYGYADLWWPTA